jgi:hypothetical protein
MSISISVVMRGKARGKKRVKGIHNAEDGQGVQDWRGTHNEWSLGRYHQHMWYDIRGEGNVRSRRLGVIAVLYDRTELPLC